MKRIFVFLTILLFCSVAGASDLLTDSFESGGLSNPGGSGGSWGATQYDEGNDYVEVSSDTAHTGSYSLKFFFEGGGSSDDAWAEQRINLPQKSEVWGRLYILIPSNYAHRNVSPSNNKFWAIYADPYNNPGFQINLSTDYYGGYSELDLHTYDDGGENSVLVPETGFITSDDLGNWLEIIVHVKVPTNTSSNDGVIEVWKDGVQLADYDSLDIFGSSSRNYIDEMYLLGWANSGFAQNTTFYIDDITISDTELTSLLDGNSNTTSNACGHFSMSGQ